MSMKSAKAIEVFFSYSHKDEELRDALEKHLSILKRQGVIQGWHDRRIGAGREWEGEIDTHLNTAHVILLLISSDFLASDYCYDVEMKRAMERHDVREACVIPVILRPVDWKGAPFGKLQALPTDAVPVTEWTNRDKAFLDVAQGIRAAVEGIEQRLTELTEEAPTVSSEPKDSSIVALSYLPPKAYHRLVGRFNELDQIMSALRDPKLKPIIAIVGLGGIGKTALAREAVERCRQEKLFDHIVWASAKTEHFVGEGINKTEVSDYSFDELLSDVGRQCNRVDIAQMPPDQKQAAVKYLLANKRVLVVTDNLETVLESEKLVASVFQILGKSKLLITSRHHVKHERVFTLDLGGFPEDEGVTFLREESKERNIEVVAQAGRESLIEIHQVTGGAPLAMKLVVGQMSRQPMKVVLHTLKQASFEGQDYPFYRFVYQHSWGMLGMNARMALVDMSVFPHITGGAVDDVQTVSQVEPSAFWPAMDQLVAMSLVDKIGPADQERLAMHPLTQYFIRSDITKEWAADE